MKFENIRVMNFENALRGMRNPKESYHLIDSVFGLGTRDKYVGAINDVANKYVERDREQGKEVTNDTLAFYADQLRDNGELYVDGDILEFALVGPNDMKLAQSLIRGGSEHRKFMRQIFVSVDITAPLYW